MTSVDRQIKPVVSVLMMTYNHGKYLNQAVESVLEQKASFPFELVIGDDCSSDNTLEIAGQLKAKYPEVVIVLSSPVNLGITPNFVRLVGACKGKYIAMLEGDDYWTDDTKLQAQFDLMEANPALALCAGRTKNRQFWEDPRAEYELPDLLRRYLFHTSTLFFRKMDVPDFVGYESVHALDTLLVSFLAEKGNCGFVDRELSYYRRHDGGAWTGKKQQQQIAATHQVTDILLNHFTGRYQREINQRELWVYSMMINFDPDKAVISQWWQNLGLIKIVLSRNFRTLPLLSCRFILSIVAQPLVSSITVCRYRLGLGSRIRSLKSGKNTV